MDYRTIKRMVFESNYPTEAQLNEAIAHQTLVMGRADASLAKHAAKIMAADHHPFPVPEDQLGRVQRRALQAAHMHARLTRLFYWRELVQNEVRTAEVGSQ